MARRQAKARAVPDCTRHGMLAAHLQVKNHVATSVEGVFSAGDLHDTEWRQVCVCGGGGGGGGACGQAARLPSVSDRAPCTVPAHTYMVPRHTHTICPCTSGIRYILYVYMPGHRCCRLRLHGGPACGALAPFQKYIHSRAHTARIAAYLCA